MRETGERRTGYGLPGPMSFAARRRARQEENWTASTATPLAARPPPSRSHGARPASLDDEFESVGVAGGLIAELSGVPVGEESAVWLAFPLGDPWLEVGDANPDPDVAWLAPGVDGGVAPGVSPGEGVLGRGVDPAVGRGVAAVVGVGRTVGRGVRFGVG